MADGNIRILHSIECGGEIFSLRYTEDGTDVCVGLLDGTIKVVNPATSQIINNLSNEVAFESGFTAGIESHLYHRKHLRIPNLPPVLGPSLGKIMQTSSVPLMPVALSGDL